MGVLESLFTAIATWFGYVGACAIAPDATCRPFLAFIALAAAASAALTLVLIAYRSAARRATMPVHPLRERRRTNMVPERAHRMLPERRRTSHTALHGRLRVA
jgi:hypothetical protein